MDIVGKWKLKDMKVPEENGTFRTVTAEEIERMADVEENKDYKEMLHALLVVAPDGTAKTYFTANDEERKEAVANGATVEEDGILMQVTEMYVENGKILFYAGTDENGNYLYKDPEFDEEGCLILDEYRLVKTE